MSLSEDLSDFFSWLDWGYVLWGRRPQRCSAISTHDIKEHTINMTSPVIAIPGLRVSVRFLHHHYLSSSFHAISLWKEITMCGSHLKSREICPTPSGRVWNSSTWEISLFSPIYLFSQLFIPPQIHGCSFDILDYNPILLNFVAQSTPVLAIGSSLSWHLCLFIVVVFVLF